MPSLVSSKLKGLSDRLRYLVKALRLIWRATRGWMVAWGIILIVQGLLPTATVYLTKVLVDGLDAALGAGINWSNVRPVLLPAALMVAILLAGQVLKGLIVWVHTAQAELIQDRIKHLIHRQAATVDLEFYETPGYFDHMARANGQAEGRTLSLLQNLGGMLQHTVTLFGIASLLIPYGFWVPLVLVVSTLPALWVVLQHSRLHHDWWENTTEQRRWAEYYDQVLTLRFTAREVRIFGLVEYFQNAYEALRKGLRDSRLRLMRNQTLATVSAGLLALVVVGATMGWMVWRALRGLATLGDVALFYQAFNQGQSLMRLLLGNMGKLYSDTLFLEHLFTFLDLEPNVTDPADPVDVPVELRQGIEIRNVSFRYPGSERLALRNFNLRIPVGATVAVVGPNGAGKSTLIKLICRFYDPTAGAVMIDGVDLRAMRTEDLWRRITVLFQDHVNYAGTIAESIQAGDMFAEHTKDKLETAAEVGLAQTVVDQYADGFQTILGKQFKGGIDLSGGQFQRLALARAFYRQAPILLLDEPTSHMDSWAETLWLDRFCDYANEHTVLIVTHRFTTAMRADLIYVLKEGAVVEMGNHDELLLQDGLYAASWTKQMQAERHRHPSPKDQNGWGGASVS